MTAIILFLCGFFSCLVLIPLAIKLAMRLGFTDKPGGRKTHKEETPAIGGLVIYPVFVLIVLLAGLSDQSFIPLFSCIAIILFAGFLDDKHDMSARFKFLVQFLVALIITVIGGIKVTYMGFYPLRDEVYLGIFAVPFTTVCIMLLINAINMIDGIDGLAGGISTIIFAMIAFIAAYHGDTQTLYLSLIITGCLIGFLIYNMRTPFNKSAKLFLGDSGSMASGVLLAWICIPLSQYGQGERLLIPASVAWLLAVPVMDAFALMMYRIAKGKSPFDADRNHLHHHFIDAGIKTEYATPLILFISFLFGAIGIFASMTWIDDYVIMFPWVVIILFHTYMKFRKEAYVQGIKAIFKRK